MIRPGEKLNTASVYDTRKRPNAIFGEETQDEMCTEFLFYYPLQKRNPSDSGVFDCYNVPGAPDVISSVCGDAKNLFSSPADSASCFSGSSFVQSRRGDVRMRDLRVGDEVAVGGGKFLRVFMFTHRVEDGMFLFVELRMLSSRLSLSAGHFVYADGQLKAAAEVGVGNRLRLAHDTEELVLSLRWVQQEGLYNPQTAHGDIVVDGVVASTYAKAVPPSAAHALLAPLRAARCGLPVIEGDTGIGARLLRIAARWTFASTSESGNERKNRS